MLSYLATVSAANITIAILIRQEYMINALFKYCWIIPKSVPLRIRRVMAKVYEYGGVHSGAAFSSTVWFTIYTGILMKGMTSGTMKTDPALVAIAWLLLGLLVSIIAFAIPTFRTASHNTFEVIHRFAGWTSLALFWTELFLFARLVGGTQSQTFSSILIREPAFWLLLVTTAHIIWPWLLLRKLTIRAEYLSDRAIRLHFTGYKVPPFCGIRISRSPLIEWHAFACIAAPDGGSVLISNGGDWTHDTIMNPRPYYYVRGIPVTGVLNMAQIFKKVVIVTTGSGIGPCLSYLAGVKTPGNCRLIWSAPDPLVSFGKEIYETVKTIDPKAIIIDTAVSGRPDLVKLAYQMYVASDAEAVFVISNPSLTKKIVYAMETRGVPGFGPVWDS